MLSIPGLNPNAIIQFYKKPLIAVPKGNEKMLFKDLYSCSNCGTAVSARKTSYFVCPNCKTPLCRKEKLEELKDHYCHRCGFKLDDAKEKALDYKRSANNIEKSKPHFANLTPSKETKQTRGMPNRRCAIEALQQLLWPEADTKKKFRTVIDYDPDFPIFIVSLFDLNPINSDPKNDDFETDHK